MEPTKELKVGSRVRCTLPDFRPGETGEVIAIDRIYTTYYWVVRWDNDKAQNSMRDFNLELLPEEPPQPEKQVEEKPKFEIGDRVRVFASSIYRVGEFGVLRELEHMGHTRRWKVRWETDGSETKWLEEHLVLATEAKKETTLQFKVGDRVRGLATSSYPGKEGTISKVDATDSDLPYKVTWWGEDDGFWEAATDLEPAPVQVISPPTEKGAIPTNPMTEFTSWLEESLTELQLQLSHLTQEVVTLQKALTATKQELQLLKAEGNTLNPQQVTDEVRKALSQMLASVFGPFLTK